MTQTNITRLVEAVERAAGEAAAAWLRAAVTQVSRVGDPERDLGMFCAMARRKLGNGNLGPGGPELAHDGIPTGTAHWTFADAGRVALILTAAGAHPSRAPVLVESSFRHGDEGERAAIVRGLALLPEPAGLKAIALEAGRINSLYLFSALALDNPYPAAFYTDHEFNQMVLKGLFNELAMERIVGLERRANHELSRMCEDYIGERVAAGRSIPADIWLAQAPFASDSGLELLRQHLAHEEPRHRYHAARALVRKASDDDELRQLIAKRLPQEPDRAIAEILRKAMN